MSLLAAMSAEVGEHSLSAAELPNPYIRNQDVARVLLLAAPRQCEILAPIFQRWGARVKAWSDSEPLRSFAPHYFGAAFIAVSHCGAQSDSLVRDLLAPPTACKSVVILDEGDVDWAPRASVLLDAHRFVPAAAAESVWIDALFDTIQATVRYRMSYLSRPKEATCPPRRTATQHPIDPPICRLEALEELQADPGAWPIRAWIQAVVSRYVNEHRLSDRQREILPLLLAGFEYKEIAARCGISPETVSTHTRLLRERIGVASTKELWRRLLEEHVTSGVEGCSAPDARLERTSSLK